MHPQGVLRNGIKRNWDSDNDIFPIGIALRGSNAMEMVVWLRDLGAQKVPKDPESSGRLRFSIGDECWDYFGLFL